MTESPLIRRVRPHPNESNTTPFCEAEVQDKNVPSFYRDRRAKRNTALGLPPKSCAQRSSYVLEGRHLCVQHAGLRALEILLAQR